MVENILGPSGRLISGSKSTYRIMNPNNLIVFNANIFTEDLEKIWYGDLDLTLDKTKLQEIAFLLNKTIYILYEMDGRFENEYDPIIENYVLKLKPNKECELNPMTKKYFEGDI